MGLDQLHDFSVPRVPNSQVLVFAARQNQCLLRVPIARFDVRLVIGKRHLFFRRGEVKHFCSGVVGAGDKLHGTAREREVSDT